jgi:hypothetical protein
MDAHERELAWAAGFFDGEGCTSLAVCRRDGKIISYKAHVCIAQVQAEPLIRFRNAVNIGKVYGPYKKESPNQQPQYRYSIQSKDGTKEVIRQLRPYLCSIKIAQAERVFSIVDSQSNMLNSKFKTHCKWGHELTSDNIYVPPKRPGRRYCKTCMKARNNGTFSEIRAYHS